MAKHGKFGKAVGSEESPGPRGCPSGLWAGLSQTAQSVQAHPAPTGLVSGQACQCCAHCPSNTAEVAGEGQGRDCSGFREGGRQDCSQKLTQDLSKPMLPLVPGTILLSP